MLKQDIKSDVVNLRDVLQKLISNETIMLLQMKKNKITRA